jgi:uncharacterized membrane-anchored protein
LDTYLCLVLLKVALSIGFVWGVALLVVGWLTSRQKERTAFHFWFALAASEAARWSLTSFLIQNVGVPLYLGGQVMPYRTGGLYGGMVVMGIVLVVGLFLGLREKRFWPGGYYAVSSAVGLLALLTARLMLI